jgi:hypothetical protein
MTIRYTEVRAIAPNVAPGKTKGSRRRNPYVSSPKKPTFVADTPDGAVWSYRDHEIVIDDISHYSRSTIGQLWSAIIQEDGDSYEETTATSEAGALRAGKLVVDLRLYYRELPESERKGHRQMLELADEADTRAREQRRGGGRITRAEIARQFELLLRDPTNRTKYAAAIDRWQKLPLDDRIDFLDEMILYHEGYLGEFENPAPAGRRKPTARDRARARRIANGGR